MKKSMLATESKDKCIFCTLQGTCMYSKKECTFGDGNVACSDYMPREQSLAKEAKYRNKKFEVSAKGLKHSFFSEYRWTGPKIWNVCTRKVRFRVESDAVYNARKHTARDGKPRRVYLCPICDGYHTSSKPVRANEEAA